jgi:hypothetical protein
MKYHGAKLILIKLQMFYQISLTYQLKCCPWLTEMGMCGSCFIEVSRKFNVNATVRNTIHKSHLPL